MPSAVAMEPLSLIGLRQRAIGSAIALFGLFALLTLYVSPMVVALRVPAVVSAPPALPTLRVPVLPIPTLAEPKLAAPAAAAPAATRVSPAPTAPRREQPATTRRAAPQAAPTVTVPVETNQYGITAQPKAQGAAGGKDPFENVPVVDDAIGTPVPALPAAPAGAAPVSAAPTAAPAAAEPVVPAAAGEDQEIGVGGSAAAPEPMPLTYSDPSLAPEAPPAPEAVATDAATEAPADSGTEPEMVAASDPDPMPSAAPAAESDAPVAAAEAAPAASEPAAPGPVESTPEPAVAPAAEPAPSTETVAPVAATSPAPAVVTPAPSPQVIYLDFGGADDVDYVGPITVSDIDVPGFVAPERFQGQEAAIIAAIKTAVETELAGQGVVITLTRPTSGDYSTVYIGGKDTPFAAYGPLYALSEKVDSGNRDPNDIAFVFTTSLPTRAKTAEAYAAEIAEYVAHEAGHLLGFEHMRTAHSHTDGDILGEVAFKPFTHVEIAKDVRADLIEDGKLDIAARRPTAAPS